MGYEAPSRQPPSWSQLPEQTRRDLSSVQRNVPGGGQGFCDRQWYEGLLPEHRIGALNAYAGLKSTGLWDRHVAGGEVQLPIPGTPTEDAGKFDFIAADVTRLKDDLRRRTDFSDPGGSPVEWEARDDSVAASMHVGQYGTNPGYINVHFDKSGLGLWRPHTWLPHLFLDAIGRGYKDVHVIRELQLDQGLDWTKPVRAPSQVDDFPPVRVGGWTGSGNGAETIGSLSWRTTNLAADRIGGRPAFPTIRMTATPTGAYPPQWSPARHSRSGPTTPPRNYTFTARELPGQIRTGPGGRLEFPGVQITGRPGTNLLRQLGDHLDHGDRAQPQRFDWRVEPRPTHHWGAGTTGPLRGLRITGTPKPNLLRELGAQLDESPSRYRFSVRQEPGPPRPRPGGGVEFPPVHVVASPDHGSYLRNLASGLR